MALQKTKNQSLLFRLRIIVILLMLFFVKFSFLN